MPVARAILSHAHSDHAIAGHGEIWATPETLAIYRRRNAGWRGASRQFRYGEALEVRGVKLEFLPAGHVLGSAQLHFEDESGSLLYTGDFKRRLSRTAAAAIVPRATTLVTEATFGLPVFRFPAQEELEERLLSACRKALEKEKTPILLAYAFGKAQEAAAILTEAGIRSVLHGAAWKLLPEYEEAGFTFPLSRPYESGPARPGEVLIVPPSCVRTPIVGNLKRHFTIYLSGWAIRETSRAEFDADLLLPFSDHADFEDLLRTVSEVEPQRVLTMHGYAEVFARILTARGIPAAPLTAERLHSAEDA